MGEPRVIVTRYAVSILPEGHEAHPHLVITVEYRGGGMWAVCWSTRVLNRNKGWDWEIRPSERTGKWLKSHRFTLAEAKGLAKEMASKVGINGRTALDILTLEGKRGEDK